ncbi:MAG: CotH kinase family protein, partial [Lachnospiraceae bacterium]|nr:CotH kinase family protein [Lachnospiraceae bacterium]
YYDENVLLAAKTKLTEADNHILDGAEDAGVDIGEDVGENKGEDTGKNTGEDIGDYIDLDSWADRYLIDEIFENYDAGVTGSYMYVTVSEGEVSPVYAGPVWDYDNCAGNIKNDCGTTVNPRIIYAAQNSRSNTVPVLWYKALLDNKDFYEKIKERYVTFYSPLIHELCEGKLNERAKELENLIIPDSARWGYGEEYIKATDDFIRHMTLRVAFLDEYFEDPGAFRSVTFKTNDDTPYVRVYVKNGEKLIPDHTEELPEDFKDYHWYDTLDYSESDLSAEVIKDTEYLGILKEEVRLQNENGGKSFTDSGLIWIFIPMGVIVCMVFVMLVRERRLLRG